MVSILLTIIFLFLIIILTLFIKGIIIDIKIARQHGRDLSKTNYFYRLIKYLFLKELPD